MCKSAVFLCGVLLYFLGSVKCSLPISAKEYTRMPPVFELEDFDRCMQYESRALYCYGTVQIQPIDPKNTTEIWKDIEKVSADPKNFRHDWLRRGICITHSCANFSDAWPLKFKDEELMKRIMGQCFNRKIIGDGLVGNITKIHCENQDPYYDLDEYDVIVGISLTTVAFIIICASIYEGSARYKPKEVYDKMFSTKWGQFIVCFSLPKNWYRLTTVSTSPDTKALSGIQGIRFFNMVLVILGHACMIGFSAPMSNTVYAEESTQRFMDILIINGAFVVQTFLMMAGMLLSYHFFLTMEGRKEVRISFLFLAFINRYIRLTPSLLVTIAVSATWINHFGRGPLWDKIVGDEYRNCRENWWTNLLYVNNYVNKEHMCLQQSWYLATDTQLFAVALVIVMIMWKYRDHVKAILVVTIGIAVSIPVVVNYVNGYDMVVRQYPEPLQELFLPVQQWHTMYSAAYVNAGAYMIGIALGYTFYKLRGNEEYAKSKTITALWWIFVWGVPLSMIFLGALAYSPSYTYHRFWASVYTSAGRNLFALGIGVLVLGTSLNIGWYIRWLLQWEGFQILGRLTYCAYLTHVFFVRLRGGFLRQPFFVADYLFVAQTLGDVIVAYVGALVLCLFIEMPISAMQKHFVPQLANRRHDGLSEKSKMRVTENKMSQEDNEISRV